MSEQRMRQRLSWVFRATITHSRATKRRQLPRAVEIVASCWRKKKKKKTRGGVGKQQHDGNTRGWNRAALAGKGPGLQASVNAPRHVEKCRAAPINQKGSPRHSLTWAALRAAFTCQQIEGRHSFPHETCPVLQAARKEEALHHLPQARPPSHLTACGAKTIEASIRDLQRQPHDTHQ